MPKWKLSKEKRLNKFLKELANASKNHGLFLQWTSNGIEIREVDDDGDPSYSYIRQDGGYDGTLVALDLIYDS